MSWKAEVSHSRTACRPAFSRIAHRRNPVARVHRAVLFLVVRAMNSGAWRWLYSVVIHSEREAAQEEDEKREWWKCGRERDVGLGALPSCMIRVLLPEALFPSHPPSFPLRSAPPRSPLRTTPRHIVHRSLTHSLTQTLLSVHHHTVRILVLALRRRQCHSSKGFSGGIYSYLLSPVYGQAVSEPSRTMTPR